MDVGSCDSKLSLMLVMSGFEVWGLDWRIYEEGRNLLLIDEGKDWKEFKHEYLDKFHFIQCDVRKTPFSHEFFDYIITVSTIEHVGMGHWGDPIDPTGDFKAVQELTRILKKNGALIITLPYGGIYNESEELRTYDDVHLSELLKGLVIKRELYLKYDGKDWHSSTKQEVKNTVSQKGYHVVCLECIKV